ncbi:hypothetical protein ARALYDRAFT_909132 [Arabidopsis lyrata subsp. lyrata]|uniref:Uncharacterized protein n=1 Tax=Arabidopsis lyrata subsp. lyrata TaxID=81972 RepID=D7M4B1_ARALL|nr:hypothetical protein ARALYDRAFT_909132 [Arabidopsis lyrata subsp. lyrata]
MFFHGNRYMPMMELGVSSNMFDIKKNALKKLSKQQSAYRIKLLSSYKEMVPSHLYSSLALRKIQVMLEFVVASLYLIFGMSLHLVRPKNKSSIVDSHVWSLRFGTCHIDMITKKMAEEFVEMFIREVMIKGLLIMELISLSTEVPQPINNSWLDELYHGEFITSHQMFFLFHGSS